VLRPGGALAVTHQPRHHGATAEDTIRVGDRIAADFRSAGFERIRVEVLEMEPLPAVCVIGFRPSTTHEHASMT
jgi:hypothetical protein